MEADCREYFERVSEYLDGELDEELCRRIRKHLDQCPECMDCIESLRKTVRLCRQAGRDRIPAETRARLSKALRVCLERQGR